MLNPEDAALLGAYPEDFAFIGADALGPDAGLLGVIDLDLELDADLGLEDLLGGGLDV